MTRALAFSTALLLVACEADAPAPGSAETQADVAVSTPGVIEGMVAAAHPLAVEAGLEILSAGGSAVDAAVAVQAALGLVEPQSSGIAGGAFLMVFDPQTGEVRNYDGREAAPSAIDSTLFQDADGEPLRYFDGILSGRSTGVPGAMVMLGKAHADYGKLDWADLFAPVIPLAEEGFTVTERLPYMLGRMEQFGSPLSSDPEAGPLWYPGGDPIEEGATLVNAAYADALRALQDNPRAMVEGPLAAAIVERLSDEPRPSALTVADMASYQAIEREPVCTEYREHRICSAAPPSSGGMFLGQALSLLEPFDMAELGPTPAGWHIFIEASRLAYADRDAYVSAPETLGQPLSALLDPNYLDSRADLIKPDSVIASAQPGLGACADATPDNPGTTHFSIVDETGLVVSMTTTVEGAFGSQRMVSGFVLNNQLTDFSFRDEDDNGCLIPNRPGPGKRPRSSMSPTIAFAPDGSFLFATGSPGGNSIPAYTLKSIVGMIDWGLTPQEAADLPNVIARGDVVRIENGAMDETTLMALRELGHEIDDSRGETSGIHIVRREADGSLTGAADSRREGVARSTLSE